MEGKASVYQFPYIVCQLNELNCIRNPAGLLAFSSVSVVTTPQSSCPYRRSPLLLPSLSCRRFPLACIISSFVLISEDVKKEGLFSSLARPVFSPECCVSHLTIGSRKSSILLQFWEKHTNVQLQQEKHVVGLGMVGLGWVWTVLLPTNAHPLDDTLQTHQREFLARYTVHSFLSYIIFPVLSLPAPPTPPGFPRPIAVRLHAAGGRGRGRGRRGRRR